MQKPPPSYAMCAFFIWVFLAALTIFSLVVPPTRTDTATSHARKICSASTTLSKLPVATW